MVVNGQWLCSDVLKLTGIDDGTPYVVQLSFNKTMFSNLLGNFYGELWLGTYIPGRTVWKNATTTDIGQAGQYAQTEVYDTYADFLATVQAAHFGATVADLVGSWGIDSNGDAWAVIDHDSATTGEIFGVVPEPGTFVLLLVARAGVAANPPPSAEDA